MGKEVLGSLELNRAYQMDCLEGMSLIPDGSIDMILCDLPYGTTANKWDIAIPFEPLWEQYERVIKENGVIALFGSEPFSTKLRSSNFSLYRYDWYWEKSKAGLYQHAKNRPMKAIETISIFSKAKWGHKSQVKNRMPYFPQGVVSSGEKVVTKNYNAGGTVGERPNQIGRKYESFTGFPNDVLKYKNVTGKQAIHSTQKPVDLCEFLIKSYTIEEEVVLDNCLGSGTTAVACELNNRKWIGFETESKYIEIINKRLEQIQLEDDLADYEKCFHTNIPLLG
ncbi:DNA-methyltransferase [Bacillus vallismortis]|uniref:DNA-methyltransferase n=1 Tax=Bacillus vallismortis TaxID=72361 RepID=UPI000289F565|nr:site-specific DNA-methyltransferase [Bacillus vallismortis]MBG9768282.1 cytosine methyltransferase [Bacillus vallismortis]MCY7919046.1 site-specific DNA-methyltransferase [Bacillus vallismortis]QAV08630.1 site-specific DNA-methyltransferase [Bacillus vallismortis]